MARRAGRPLPGGYHLAEDDGALAPAAADFLREQGPLGFAAGSLLEWTCGRDRGAGSAAPTVAGILGPDGALHAVVIRRGGRAIAAAPLVDAWPAVLAVVRAWRPDLDRLGLSLPLHDHLAAAEPGVLAGSFGYTVWLTRLGILRTPARPLPPARRVRAADAAAVQAIYRHVTWMRDDDADSWRRRLRRQPAWVAELDGRAVAVARWTHAFAGAVEVGGVACAPSARRRGAATAAIMAAIRAARRAGRTVLLSYGDPELGPLYQGLGFEHVGRHRFLEWATPT